MNDTLKCPICKSKLKNKNLLNHNLYLTNSIGNYIQRTCSGMNHMLQFFIEIKTKKVVGLKTSLVHDYSKFIEINFIDNKSKITCFKMGIPNNIYLPNIPRLDFPEFKELNDKINKLITFS